MFHQKLTGGEMRWLKFVLTLCIAVAAVVGLNMRIGLTPPLGKLLDPFHGFWQNGLQANADLSDVLTLPGLRASVAVKFDDRMVPHIFADNDHDLYFAQGYVTARDRLWQMEFQTHAAAGRLSEIFGERTLSYDLSRRRVGMLVGAEHAVAAMRETPEIWQAVEAYTAGINAYIASLQPKDYPVEYKIFDYAPEKWTSLKCALLLKYMAWMLTGRSRDLQMSNTLARFGPRVVDDLFPDFPKQVDPVIPPDTRWPFKPLPLKKPQDMFQPGVVEDIPPFEPDDARGSNNWAVAGTKTSNGYPLLSNDPHLELNLPSIWYEVQLSSPSVNVYGVSLQGVPNVIIGFNEQIAWGVTNAETDIMDWYEITFKGDSLDEYLYDGQWRKTRKIVEEVKVRGGKTVLDTVVYTHHGPIVQRDEKQRAFRMAAPRHAMRWVGLDTSREALAFYKLNRASNYDEFVQAIRYYACPAQNFVFADQDGDIALWHNGKFPAKWQGQGKYICDGSDPLYDWQGWIPHKNNPHVKNPQRGFVSSANQHAVTEDYPYFFIGYYAPYFRGKRINQRLAEMDNVTPEDFRKLQLDTKNLHAESVLPTLLKYVNPKELTEREQKVYEALAQWDFFNEPEKMAPTIFKEWWRRLYTAIWYDEFNPEEMYLRLPSGVRTVQMIIEEPEAKWFDNVNTDEEETLADIILTSFKEEVASLHERLGDMGDAWRWGRYKGTEIRHLARLPGFGSDVLNVGGDRGIVNAITGSHGPSWRMIVQLGPVMKAWGIYPGGQSGNPGSPHYDDFIDHWVHGEVAPLLFLESEDVKNKRIVATMKLEVEK